MKFTAMKELFVALTIGVAAGSAALASPLTSVTTWGTLDPGCTSEHATCATDPAFSPSSGGYRAGGSVSWGDPLNPASPFVFDTSAFGSISSITLEVLVVGFYPPYQGNIDSSGGQQIGNYLAIDGTPFAPFLNMTDGRDTRVFDLTGVLSPGSHTFSVVAYQPPGPNYEGWAGVDIAKLTVVGDTEVSAVPVPAAAPLLATGLGVLGLVHWRYRRRIAKLAA